MACRSHGVDPFMHMQIFEYATVERFSLYPKFLTSAIPIGVTSPVYASQAYRIDPDAIHRLCLWGCRG